MKINNQTTIISKSPLNIAFKGIYSLRGDVESINSAKKMIIEGAGLEHFKFKFKPINEMDDVVTIGVATGKDDIDKMDNNGFLKLAQTRIIDAAELINPFKTVKFNSKDGIMTNVFSFYKDGKEFISSNRYIDDNSINLIKFDKPLPILEGLSELAQIPEKIILNKKAFYYHKSKAIELLEYSDDIAKCEDLNKLKIKGLCGVGGSSIALELPNNNCLKLSFEPNAPFNDEIYDIPTILKRKLKIKYPPVDYYNHSLDYIYYTIQKRGFNKNEYYFTSKYTDEVRKAILKTNPYSEIEDFDERQIAIFKGKPYLVDAPVVANRPFYE